MQCKSAIRTLWGYGISYSFCVYADCMTFYFYNNYWLDIDFLSFFCLSNFYAESTFFIPITDESLITTYIASFIISNYCSSSSLCDVISDEEAVS